MMILRYSCRYNKYDKVFEQASFNTVYVTFMSESFILSVGHAKLRIAFETFMDTGILVGNI